MRVNLNRREILKASAASAALLFASGEAAAQKAPADAPLSEIKRISMEECRALTPAEIGRNSGLVRAARAKLAGYIESVSNPALRSAVLDIYTAPEPGVVTRLDAKNADSVYEELAAKGYTQGRSYTSPPPGFGRKAKETDFLGAPGNGYQSHHAYPGGLVTHVAANVEITDGIVKTYKDIYGYPVDRDAAITGQLLHDLHKPYVFQWGADNISRKEQQLAGTGEHHVLSAAEMMYRKLPAEVIYAAVCAHNPPSSEKEEAIVTGWPEAAAIIAGIDPVAAGLIRRTDKSVGLVGIPRQAGYIVSLGDHDYVLSGPAVKKTLPIMQEVARDVYKIKPEDAAAWNALRNKLFAEYSAMKLHQAAAQGGHDAVEKIMLSVVKP